MTAAIAPTVAGPLPSLVFRLPGQWWQIPLDDRDAASSSIKALLKNRFAHVDELAQFRHDLKRQFLAALEQAIEGDGVAMHVAINIVEDMPISASVCVYLPDVSISPAVGTAPVAVMDIAQQGIEASSGGAAGVRFSAHESEVLRVSRRSVIETKDDQDDLPLLLVDYWMTIPGTKRIILLTFATAFADIEEAMVTFFDSIVVATWWRRPEAEAVSP